MLGEAFIELGDSQSAEIELQRAAQFGAPPVQAALLLGETKLQQSRFDQVLRDHAVDESAPAEIRAAVLALRGRAHAGLGQRLFAEEAFKAALALDERSVASLLGLARLSPSTVRWRATTRRAPRPSPRTTSGYWRCVPKWPSRPRNLTPRRRSMKILTHRKKRPRCPPRASRHRATISPAARSAKAIGRLNIQLTLAPAEPIAHYLRALAAFTARITRPPRGIARSRFTSPPRMRRACSSRAPPTTSWGSTSRPCCS